MVQHLSQDPYFVLFFEWIENDVYTEDQRRIVIQENKEHPTRREGDRRVFRPRRPADDAGEEGGR